MSGRVPPRPRGHAVLRRGRARFAASEAAAEETAGEGGPLPQVAPEIAALLGLAAMPPSATPPATIPGLRLFGTVFSTGTAADILSAVSAMRSAGPRLIVTANVDHAVVLSENAPFRKAYEGAAARTLDGLPLVWLARFLGARRAARITGHDLLAAAIAAPPAPDTRIFLVASDERAAARVKALFVRGGLPDEAVATTVPPFGFEMDPTFSGDLAGRIRAHGTSLLVMGVGAPKSEIWVDRMGEALGSPVVLPVGEALNVAAGLVPRAPLLMQRIGLEWFFRFLHAPRRLFRRYFIRSWRFLGIASREIGDLHWPAARPSRPLPAAEDAPRP